MTENIAELEKTLRPAEYNKNISKKIRYVGLGPQAYFEFIKMLDDDYLTEWETMKMRYLFRDIWRKSFLYPLAVFAGFWMSFYRIFGLKNPRHLFYRSFRFFSSLGMANVTLFYINSWNVGNK